MEIYDDIAELLNKEREIFLEVEKITNLLLTAEIEELSGILEERGDLLQKAVSIENEINTLTSDHESIRSVLKNSCDMSSLSSDLQRIYDASMRVKTVINRINNLEPDIRMRMESEKSIILEKLESLKKSSDFVAGNYKRSVQLGFPQFSLLDREKTI